MDRYTLDAPGSRLAVRTFAEGMFSPLAHDLELEFPLGDGGEASADGPRWTARLVARVAGVRVAGTVRRGIVDPGGLAARDRAEVERKVREEVFAGAGELVVDVSGEGASGRATVKLGAREASVPVVLESREGALVTTGRAEVSVRSLGIREVRGPLNAFRVRDAVEVRLVARWVPAGG